MWRKGPDWYWVLDIFAWHHKTSYFQLHSILLKVHNQRHVPSQQQRVNDFSMQIAISISDIESPKLQNSLCTLFKVSTVESWKKTEGGFKENE